MNEGSTSTGGSRSPTPNTSHCGLMDGFTQVTTTVSVEILLSSQNSLYILSVEQYLGNLLILLQLISVFRHKGFSFVSTPSFKCLRLLLQQEDLVEK